MKLDPQVYRDAADIVYSNAWGGACPALMKAVRKFYTKQFSDGGVTVVPVNIGDIQDKYLNVFAARHKPKGKYWDQYWWPQVMNAVTDRESEERLRYRTNALLETARYVEWKNSLPFWKRWFV